MTIVRGRRLRLNPGAGVVVALLCALPLTAPRAETEDWDCRPNSQGKWECSWIGDGPAGAGEKVQGIPEDLWAPVSEAAPSAPRQPAAAPEYAAEDAPAPGAPDRPSMPVTAPTALANQPPPDQGLALPAQRPQTSPSGAAGRQKLFGDGALQEQRATASPAAAPQRPSSTSGAGAAPAPSQPPLATAQPEPAPQEPVLTADQPVAPPQGMPPAAGPQTTQLILAERQLQLKDPNEQIPQELVSVGFEPGGPRDTSHDVQMAREPTPGPKMAEVAEVVEIEPPREPLLPAESMPQSADGRPDSREPRRQAERVATRPRAAPAPQSGLPSPALAAAPTAARRPAPKPRTAPAPQRNSISTPIATNRRTQGATPLQDLSAASAPPPRRQAAAEPPRQPRRASPRQAPESQPRPRSMPAPPRTAYTIQLVAAGNPQGLQRFKQEARLGADAWIGETDKNGKPWYTLNYGLFRNHTEAKTARDTLPAAALAHTPWIRTTAPDRETWSED